MAEELTHYSKHNWQLTNTSRVWLLHSSSFPNSSSCIAPNNGIYQTCSLFSHVCFGMLLQLQ